MMPLILGGLAMGGSLLSSLGSQSAAKSQARRQAAENMEADRVNQQRLASLNNARLDYGSKLLDATENSHTSTHTVNHFDADGFRFIGEKLGYNPVTWLNSGALSMFNNVQQITNTTRNGHNAADAYKMMLPDIGLTTPNQASNNGSFMGAVGGALSAGVSAFGTQHRADQSYDLQMAKMLGGATNWGMGLSQGNGLSVVTSTGGGGGRAGGGANTVGGLSSMAYPQKWELGKVEATNPSNRGWFDPSQANAQNQEDRSGEAGGIVYGISNEFHDMVRNVTGRTIRDWGRAAGVNIGDYKKPGDTDWFPSFGRWWSSPTGLPAYFRSPGPNLPYIGAPM